MNKSTRKPVAVSPGTKWPGGAYVDIAVLNITSDYLLDLLGRPLVEGVEPGLGSWHAIGARLESGALIELISYEQDVPERFILRVEAKRNLAEVFNEALTSLGLAESAITWRRPYD